MLGRTSSAKQPEMPTSTSKGRFSSRRPSNSLVLDGNASQLADCVRERVQQASQGRSGKHVVSFVCRFFSAALFCTRRLPLAVAASFTECEVDGVFHTFLLLLGHHLATRSANVHFAPVCVTADSRVEKTFPALAIYAASLCVSGDRFPCASPG